MKKYKSVSLFYYVSAAYDGILGLTFLMFPLAIFNWYETTPPNHMGYIYFAAALLIVFAIMFINIGRKPLHNRNLILS